MAIALTASAVGPQFALCVGTDGHRAVEPVAASCCDREAHPATDADAGCAKSCVDSPLRFWLETPATGHHVVGASVVSAAPVSVPLVTAAVGVRPTSLSWIERGDPDRPSLSRLSTVLRC